MGNDEAGHPTSILLGSLHAQVCSWFTHTCASTTHKTKPNTCNAKFRTHRRGVGPKDRRALSLRQPEDLAQMLLRSHPVALQQRSLGEGTRAQRGQRSLLTCTDIACEHFEGETRRREEGNQSVKAQTVTSPQVEMNLESSQFY